MLHKLIYTAATLVWLEFAVKRFLCIVFSRLEKITCVFRIAFCRYLAVFFMRKTQVIVSSLLIAGSIITSVAAASDDTQLKQEMVTLRRQALELQTQINQLRAQLSTKQHTTLHARHIHKRKLTTHAKPNATTPVVKSVGEQMATEQLQFHTSSVSAHSLDADPESLEFYPTALVVDNRVLTYIAGTPVVSSPYLGSRPAFDGSDYMVNVSSINRDVRLMQQRRGLERAYRKVGYPIPERPIIAISGKVEPLGTIGQPFFGHAKADWNLGSDELDVAAIVNKDVEAYMALAYDPAITPLNAQRVNNSVLGLNMGFINIGDLDRSPIYFTAGQLYAPFGRFSTSMISGTLPMRLARVRTRPLILGYKSQTDTGPFAAIYAFRGDTETTGVGGVNLGYIFDLHDDTGEFGVSLISALNNAGGMQYTGSTPGFNTGNFGGFASFTNGNENVYNVAGVGAHASINVDRYSLTVEWVGSAGRFRTQDLSFNGRGAAPQALQVEGGVTFMAFDRPSSVAVGYQWSKETLALNFPEQRINAVYNISIWKDTVESLEYRYDQDFNRYQFANGAAPLGYVNANTLGTGSAAHTLLAQIGIYF